MPSTFFGLNIGTTGLNNYHAALNTTAHNVSNADAKGYSRQEVRQVASQALSLNNQYGMAGTGVTTTGIEQVRNQYYDIKYWNNNTLYGQYASKEYYMLAIENYFSETNADGITAGFDQFYTSLTSLATDASNPTIRTQVSSYGESFTTYVNYLYEGLKSIQEESNFEIKNTADQINSLAQQIASLNKQINTIEATGASANDLRDARALRVDELSELANVTISERLVGEGKGVNQYIVRIDGKVLVDTYEYNVLNCEPSKTKNNQNDIEGLYELSWDNGQNFNAESRTLGGKLQALFDVRDGNNLETFKGVAKGIKGESTIIISGGMSDLTKLNIPESDGEIYVGNQAVEYESFTGEFQADGTIQYTFHLKKPLSKALDGVGEIGKTVDYKGIPYYMSQLNEFVRTFTSAFNELHNSGQDLKGNNGSDFFNGTHPTTGDNFTLLEKYAVSETFSSQTSKNADGNTYASYYSITAKNFTVTKEVAEDPNKIACAKDIKNGVEDIEILDKLLALKSNVSMFKQGTPDTFLQTLTAEIGIDSKKAQTFSSSQNNILKAIDSQRMSISGVDTDEEAMNLVKFKNAYNLSAKVISVMDEIFDKLINQMGV